MGTINDACMHRQCAQYCMARHLLSALIAELEMLNPLAAAVRLSDEADAVILAAVAVS